MDKGVYLLILISFILCGIGFYLRIRKTDKKDLAFIVYSIITTLSLIVIVLMLQLFYKDNALYINIRLVALLSIMMPIAYIDFRELRIPNEYIIIGIMYWVLSVFIELLYGSQFIVANLLSALIAAAILFLASALCKVCIKGSIGAGDIKLFLVMGLLLGLDGIWSAIFLSLIISFIMAVFFLITKKKGRKDAIPFGPALAIGTWLSIFLTGM